MKILYRLWIEKNGKPVFGRGVHNLLELVESTGSLHKAAEELKMSYRAAWGRIREYEKRLDMTLVEKGRQGRTGAKLTPDGKKLMENFAKLESRFDELTNLKDFKEIFHPMKKSK
ncbi:MAG TPA: LysR family transcriptional regulator [Desulfomonilia bacterium]